MPQAYVAKPDIETPPSDPPGWNPDWDFPGPSPPGYDPDVRSARVVLTWAHGATSWTYHFYSGFVRLSRSGGIFGKADADDNTGDNGTWSLVATATGVTGDTDSTEAFVSGTEFDAFVRRQYGYVELAEFLDDTYIVELDFETTYVTITFTATLIVYYNGEIESTTVKTVVLNDDDWDGDWLSINGGTGEITLINP